MPHLGYPLPKRLKTARLRAGLSQKTLGIAIGLDEFGASARMNQYERGKHEPDYSMVERIAKVLDVPESYFYAKDDEAAWLLVVFHRMSPSDREKLVGLARDLAP